VADGNATGAGGSAGNGDDAAWLDLVARFDAPAPAIGADVPWPDREDLAGPVHVTPPLTSSGPPAPPAVPGLPALGGPPTMPDQPLPAADPFPDDLWPGPAVRSGPREAPFAADPSDDHYIPPVPPPLPRLDPATKLAWLALFGGPLYLLVSTAVGATISGLAAFLAVAAFVGGFVVLVLRMDNGRPPDSGSDDDGAVV
jgi:hypothetical protein